MLSLEHDSRSANEANSNTTAVLRQINPIFIIAIFLKNTTYLSEFCWPWIIIVML
jgi:hypothetical protein